MSEIYDFIIIGGGTAGLVLANRLSEDGTTSVLVLEAGTDKDQDPRVTIPGLWRANFNTEQDWAFQTIPQKNLNGRVINHSQGKMLGGSSSINLQALIPPSASDLNVWEKIGNPGWDWPTMKPYLKGFFSLSQPEDHTHESLALAWANDFWPASDASSVRGLVQASFTDVEEERALAVAWIKAISNIGYPLTDNPFDGTSTGPYNGASTINPTTKTRVSSSIAYYHPAKDRKNLRVLASSPVERIVIEETEGSGFRATGVICTLDGKPRTLGAAKEVILCAGVFQSPKLLELSGIGDPDILTKHGINTKIVNPFVGTNLQDHLLHAISYETSGSIPTRDALVLRDPAAIQKAMEAYTINRTGPLCSSAVTSFAYLPVDDLRHDTQLAEGLLSTLSQTSSSTNHPLDCYRTTVLESLIKEQNGGTAQYFPFVAQSTLAGDNPKPADFISFVASLSHPLSTGTVHIASADPSVPPTIDHNYLSHPLDVELQARHVRYIEKIAATEPLAALLKKGGLRNNEAAFIGDNLDKAKEYLKLAGSTNYHSVGTCAMAPRGSGGVVDPMLRVYGVTNLRVVDASIMPLVPQSNTQALVYAIAERAADIIRGRALS